MECLLNGEWARALISVGMGPEGGVFTLLTPCRTAGRGRDVRLRTASGSAEDSKTVFVPGSRYNVNCWEREALTLSSRCVSDVSARVSGLKWSE